MNREEYERDLRERQRKHLESIQSPFSGQQWQPCLHDQCPSCHGTGIRSNGSICVHGISCNCHKCSITCYSGSVNTSVSYNHTDVT